MLKLFGSPRKVPKETQNVMVPMLDGHQPHNPYTLISVHTHHTDIIRHLLLLDKYRVASAGDDGLVIVWNIQTGEKQHVLSEHNRPVTCLHVLPGGATVPQDTPLLEGATISHTILLSAASDKLICMWDIETGNLLHRLTEHSSTARCLLTLTGEEYFCSGGEKLGLWSIQGGLITVLDRPNEEDVSQIIELRDSRLVASVDKRPVVYSIRQNDGRTTLTMNRKLAPHREAVTCLLKVNEACFMSGSLDGTIVLWSAQALAPSRYFNSITDYLGDNRVLPYSIQAMVCLEERYLVCAIGTGFCVYDIIPGRLVAQRRQAHYSKILSVAVVYSGLLLATTSEDGAIRFWGCMKNFMQHTPVNNTASALEKLLGIGSADAKLLKEKDEKIEPQLLGECLGHSGAVRVCVDAGIEGVLTGGADGLVINWKDGLQESMRLNSELHDLYNSLNTT